MASLAVTSAIQVLHTARQVSCICAPQLYHCAKDSAFQCFHCFRGGVGEGITNWAIQPLLAYEFLIISLKFPSHTYTHAHTTHIDSSPGPLSAFQCYTFFMYIKMIREPGDEASTHVHACTHTHFSRTPFNYPIQGVYLSPLDYCTTALRKMQRWQNC